MFVEEFYTQKKWLTETLIEEVQSVVLETDGLESPEEPHPYASFGTLSRSNFR